MYDSVYVRQVRFTRCIHTRMHIRIPFLVLMSICDDMYVYLHACNYTYDDCGSFSQEDGNLMNKNHQFSLIRHFLQIMSLPQWISTTSCTLLLSPLQMDTQTHRHTDKRDTDTQTHRQQVNAYLPPPPSVLPLALSTSLLYLLIYAIYGLRAPCSQDTQI